MLRWLDKLTLRAYVSTAGDFISLGATTQYPFQSGGANGVPLNWARQITGTANIGDVTFTTASELASISHIAGQPVRPSAGYNIQNGTSFGVKPGFRYVIRFRVRTMQDKQSATWQVLVQKFDFTTMYAQMSRTSQQDWEDVTIATPAMSAGDAALGITLGVLVPSTATTQTHDTFGIQFTSLSVTEQALTYPDPTWSEISCDLRSVTTAYGRSARLNRYEVATSSVELLNTDGAYSYRPNHPLGLRPGRFVKMTIGEMEQQFLFPNVTGNYFTIPDKPALRVTGALEVIFKMSAPSISAGFVCGKSGAAPNAGWFIQWFDSNRLQFYGSQDGSSLLSSTTDAAVPRPSDAVWYRVTFNPVTHQVIFYTGPDSPKAPKTWRQWSTPQSTTLNSLYPSTAPFSMGGGPSQRLNARLSSLIVFKGIGGPSVVEIGESNTDIDTTNVFTDYKGNTVNVVTTTGQDIIQSVNLSVQPLFYGLIDNLKDGYTWEGQAITILDLKDVSTLLANTQVPTALVSETLSGSRVTQLLIAAGWHPTMKDVEIGQYVMQPIYANGRTIRDELGLIGDSERSFFFTGRDGYITYRDRTWPTRDINQYQVTAELLALQSTGTLPIVDYVPDQVDKAVICVRTLETDWSRQDIVNELQLANAGGIARVFIDSASQSKFGPITYQRTDLLNSNSYPEYITERAGDVMAGYTDAVLRIRSTSFKPQTLADYNFATEVFLNYLVRVRYENPREKWGYSVVTRVQSVQHSFTMTDWDVTLRLDDPVVINFWDSIQGEGWDVSEWDTDVWDAAGT